MYICTVASTGQYCSTEGHGMHIPYCLESKQHLYELTRAYVTYPTLRSTSGHVKPALSVSFSFNSTSAI